MDKEEIKDIALNMKTKQELLALLNRIKREELYPNVMVPRFYPFTIRHITHYCNPNQTRQRYKKFRIKKKSGGYREIAAPWNKTYMELLQAVNIILKSIYNPSDYAMGFAEGRSVVNNARTHCALNYVYNIDLKDFFPSIEQPRVWKRLQLKPFGFPVEIANVIAGLCSIKETRIVDGQEEIRYCLPQGAPTSPIITNMICDNLDRKLAGVAKRFGLNYTRYADDITFSSMHNVYQKDGEFIQELNRIIKEQGFTINTTKTRLQKRGAQQEVTGLVVCSKVNVKRKYIRDIDNILYIWERYGLSVAEVRFHAKYVKEKGHVKKSKVDLINVLSGKLQYLKMVKGNKDNVYIRLYDKFLRLAGESACIMKFHNTNVMYMETTPMQEFERNLDIRITVEKTKFGRRGYSSNPERTPIYVAKLVKDEDIEEKDKLAISRCKDKQQNIFWLIHYRNKNTRIINQANIINKLNDELDSLLNS